MMMAAGTLRGEWSQLFFTPRTVTALVYLSTLGAIGGFVAYTYALRHLSVSFVSLYAYVNPVIAVALGMALLDEPFTPRMAAAAAMVFAGVAVVRWKGRRKTTGETTAEHTQNTAATQGPAPETQRAKAETTQASLAPQKECSTS